MKLVELFEPTPTGYRSEKDDETVIHSNDTRKTRLTFDRLHSLRVINDVRKLENEKKIGKLADQYKLPAAEAGGLSV